jgi:hypothetical protein
MTRRLHAREIVDKLSEESLKRANRAFFVP